MPQQATSGYLLRKIGTTRLAINQDSSGVTSGVYNPEKVRLQPGDKASIHIKKPDRYLPVTITGERWDRRGNLYYTATHANGEWAAELDAQDFISAWPDGTNQIPADAQLTQRARAVFLEAGALRAVAIPAQLARAIANSLWPQLKRDKWREHTCTRDIDAHNPGHGTEVGPRGFPKAPSASSFVVQHHERYIEAMLYAEEWFGDDALPAENYAIRLTQDAYDRVLWDTPFATSVELRTAFQARVRYPFGVRLNKNGSRKLRRNDHEPAMTPAVAATLERVASAARAVPVGEETVEAYLNGDIDFTPDVLSSP